MSGGAEFMLKSKESVKASTSVRRWTQTAIDCYKRGCVCSGCFYSNFFKDGPQRCQMKTTVLELVRSLGTPNVELKPSIIENNMQCPISSPYRPDGLIG